MNRWLVSAALLSVHFGTKLLHDAATMKYDTAQQGHDFVFQTFVFFQFRNPTVEASTRLSHTSCKLVCLSYVAKTLQITKVRPSHTATGETPPFGLVQSPSVLYA